MFEHFISIYVNYTKILSEYLFNDDLALNGSAIISTIASKAQLCNMITLQSHQIKHSTKFNNASFHENQQTH